MEVDTQRNIVRAIAVGATEMRSKDRMNQKLDQEKLLEIVAENLDAPKSELKVAAQNGVMYAVQYTKVEKKLFGLVKKSSNQLRLIDEEGVIRLQKNKRLGAPDHGGPVGKGPGLDPGRTDRIQRRRHQPAQRVCGAGQADY